METKEKFERAKRLYKTANADQKYVLESLFPELAESEDERIRKNCIHFLELQKQHHAATFEIEECIAWLEKQGKQNLANSAKTCKDEQNPNPCDGCVNRKGCINCENGELRETEQKPAWSEEDEVALCDALWCCKQAASIAKDENDMGNVWFAENWLKSLKDRVQPKQEWSEENENRVNRLIAYFEDKESFTAEDDIVYANWLKSLRPQNTWKPRDEQMKALKEAVDEHFDIDGGALWHLYEDLKKLKE